MSEGSINRSAPGGVVMSKWVPSVPEIAQATSSTPSAAPVTLKAPTRVAEFSA